MAKVFGGYLNRAAARRSRRLLVSNDLCHTILAHAIRGGSKSNDVSPYLLKEQRDPVAMESAQKQDPGACFVRNYACHNQSRTHSIEHAEVNWTRAGRRLIDRGRALGG
jgi:hypothetical protein